MADIKKEPDQKTGADGQNDVPATKAPEKKSKLKFKRYKSKAPDIKVIEAEEQKTKHFAQGMGFYKLFWIFFIGSFLGVLIENIWCFATQFKFESRAGLVWGPFNLVYGFGAFAMALGLYPLRHKRDGYVLLGGAAIGSLVEFLSSWVQERIFGTISWDYSQMPFNLQGRINLLYALFWGILAVLWVKEIYPRLASLILKIPNKIGKPLTWILLVFMIANSLMSAFAVDRWVERLNGDAPENGFEEYLDRHYDNDRMEWTYPNMRFAADGGGSDGFLSDAE